MFIHSTEIVPYGNAVMELCLGVELAFLPLHCTLYSGADWLELTNKFRAVVLGRAVTFLHLVRSFMD